MPLDLTPLAETTETLTSVAESTETLTAVAADDVQTLVSLGEEQYGYEFLLPSETTYPSSTTYPGIYGAEIGVRMTSLAEGGETLTVLTED